MSGKLTDQQKIDIVKEYTEDQETTLNSLGRKYKVNYGTIGSILRKRGVSIRNNQSVLSRIYTLDETVFEKIDNEEKAYWLGFLYADGCNMPESNYLNLSLQEKDKYILYRYADFFKTNKPLRLKKEIKNGIEKQNSWGLEIYSNKICEDLVNLGCVPRKTFSLKFPTEDQVPNNLIRHFVRGIFDGDGCYTLRNKMVGKFGPYLSVSAQLTSTEHVCLGLQKLITEVLDSYSAIKFHENKITRILTVESKDGFYRLCKWMYQDSTIYLERKYKKYLQFLELAKGKYDDRWNF